MARLHIVEAADPYIDDVLDDEAFDDIDGLVSAEDGDSSRWAKTIDYRLSIPMEQALSRFCALRNCSRATGLRWALMMAGRRSKLYRAATPDEYIENLVRRALYDHGYLREQIDELAEMEAKEYERRQPEPQRVGFLDRLRWILGG